MSAGRGDASASKERIGKGSLEAFTRDVFVHAGVAPADAESVAEVLVWANLRGVDSHGVIRVPSYLDYIARGRMDPAAKVEVVREKGAILSVDAHRALGPAASVAIMRKAIETARHAGIGWSVVRNMTHQGALGYYALRAADAGMIGIVNTCGTPVMAAHGARVAGVHNSPIAIAVPANRYRPLLLDMAHSVAAGGKIRHAADAGTGIPAGWALDESGQPTTDPARARVLLPLGGPKGSGVAIMFECLSSLLAQNPVLSVALPAMLAGAPRDHAQNGVVAALDIAAFTDPADFRREVDRLIESLKKLPTAAGHAEVYVPGELGFRTYEERSRDGIPLPAGTIAALRAAAESSGVPFPAFH